MNKPPRLAMAILMRLGPRQEPLVGDLVEEFAAGRSRSWFWRQALAAVVGGAIRGIRCQPFRTVGAMTTGWAVLYIVSVTLPFHWRAGFLLVPLVMLACGLAVGRGRSRETPRLR